MCVDPHFARHPHRRYCAMAGWVLYSGEALIKAADTDKDGRISYKVCGGIVSARRAYMLTI